MEPKDNEVTLHADGSASFISAWRDFSGGVHERQRHHLHIGQVCEQLMLDLTVRQRINVKIHLNFHAPEYVRLLASMDVCGEALYWCRTEGGETLESAWENCPRGTWMEWLMERVPARARLKAGIWNPSWKQGESKELHRAVWIRANYHAPSIEGLRIAAKRERW